MKHCRFLPLLLAVLLLSSCASAPPPRPNRAEPADDTAEYLCFLSSEPDTVDPQCTTEFYTLPLNIFDRLVEIQVLPDGSSQIVPSLADAWEVSADGLRYTFHLHEGVKFSNGSALTASDVKYTLTRLLTHPNTVNRDLVVDVLGAQALRDGTADTLAGVELLSDLDFVIVLSQPNAAFLACLSTPGASILDEESTEAAGDLFGLDPASTIGTGPFIWTKWKPESELLLQANSNCWAGPPRCAGLTIKLLSASDTEMQRKLFEEGELDILDLDNMGSDAEYFLHGDIFQSLLRSGPRVGITYLALNETVEPLNDVRVRKALQISLDRQMLLDACYSGRGTLENGIFPHGLIGFNPNLPALPYDMGQARALLAEAGYADGFDLTLSVSANSSQTILDLMALIAAMWGRIGVRATVEVLDSERFMELRKAGELACYTSTWSADYNDPDNFIYTFFGSSENTKSRSLCYPNEEIMQRVADARAIVDNDARLREYRALEQIIIQEDAAWVPLFSKTHYFVVNDRVDGFQVAWNGWSSTNYRNVALRIEETDDEAPIEPRR